MKGATATGTFTPGPETIGGRRRAHRTSSNPGADETGWLAQTGHVPLGYLGDEAKTPARSRSSTGSASVPGDRAIWREPTGSSSCSAATR
jgi:hypothetical protein